MVTTFLLPGFRASADPVRHLHTQLERTLAPLGWGDGRCSLQADCGPLASRFQVTSGAGERKRESTVATGQRRPQALHASSCPQPTLPPCALEQPLSQTPTLRLLLLISPPKLRTPGACPLRLCLASLWTSPVASLAVAQRSPVGTCHSIPWSTLIWNLAVSG